MYTQIIGKECMCVSYDLCSGIGSCVGFGRGGGAGCFGVWAVCVWRGGLVCGLLGLSKEETQPGLILPEGDALAHGVSGHP